MIEDELICLDESTRDVLVHHTPPKKIVDLSVEVVFKEKLKFLENYNVDTPIMLCDNNEFVRRMCEKKSRRRQRKVMKQVGEDESKDDKKIDLSNLSLEENPLE